MTTPSNILDQVPSFLGEDGFNQMLASVNPQREEAYEVDPDLAKSALLAAKPIYAKADAAQANAEKALKAIEELEKKQLERDEKAAKIAKERENAQEFDAVNEEFSKAMGNNSTLSEVFSLVGYEELAKQNVEGLGFDITYDQIIASTMSSKQYAKTAAILKTMHNILNPNSAKGKTVLPSTNGGGAVKPQESGYMQDIKRVNQQYAGRFSFSDVKEKTNAIKEVKAKYGLPS